jgi:hypothetical protein
MTSYMPWWHGHQDDIPAELLEAVFPGLDEVFLLAKELGPKIDESSIKFCETLVLLRKTYIEVKLCFD